MENIPYYDFSKFPFNSNVVVEKIKLAAQKELKVIFINFGSFFPWSIENISRSKYAYTDKLIDKIVSICHEHDIILVPSLSILTNSDFILNDNKYQHLISTSKKQKGLDLSACGAGKLVEKMIDDLYSLMCFSNYLLIELPELNYNISSDTKINLINFFIKRIADNLNDNDKRLILGCSNNCENYEKQFLTENIQFIYKKQNNKYDIFNSKSYNLDLIESKSVLNGNIYNICLLNGTDGFDAGLDISELISYYDKDTGKTTAKINVIDVEIFFSLVEESWSLIRLCWEELSCVYRYTDPEYRVTFIRSVKKLNLGFDKLKKSSHTILDTFEKVYQPGIIREWVNSKIDSVLNQLNTLENLIFFMNEGN